MRSISQKFGAPPLLTNFKPQAILSDTLDITVETPMVGGGFDAGCVDENHPFRAPSIRGHLRYWWRILNWDKPDMPKKESEIWGSTDKSSAVKVEILEHECKGTRKFANNYDFDNKYGPEAYALFSASQNKNDILKEGAAFTLKLIYPEKFTHDVRLALSAWIHFGGIGARTRRGCGALSCENKNIASIADILKANKNITLWRKTPRDKTKALAAWTEVLELYRRYRQSRPKPQARSQWPEPDSLRELTGCRDPRHQNLIRQPGLLPSFPRAALGLPIIFQFKNGNDSKNKNRPRSNLEPYNVTLTPKGDKKTRMPSPVITKAIREGGIWYSAVIILPHEHVYNLELKTDIPKNVPDFPPMRSEIYKTLEPMKGSLDAIEGFEAFIASNKFKKEMIS